MPNWVTNTMIIKADADTINDLKDKIKAVPGSDGEYYDIGKSLYPKPIELNFVEGSSSDKCWYWYDENDERILPPSTSDRTTKGFKEEDWGKKVELDDKEKDRLIDEHGACNWYDWNIINYGSKWADCYTQVKQLQNGNLIFGFESAWAPLVKLAYRISEDFGCTVVLKHDSIDNAEKGEIRFREGDCYFDKWELWDLQEFFETDEQKQKKEEE